MGYSPEDERLIDTAFDRLMEHCTKICKTEKDADLIKRAFFLAKEAHEGVRRRSGEPYILHPLAVAMIVVDEIGLGVKSVVAALLHDVVEDTDYTVDDIESMFGPKIAQMVDGLTKMSGVFKTETSEQAENFRKVLLTLSDDVRVILIKIADRLHNMRTLGSMPPHKQMKITSETIYLFAPLAHRLGLYAIKSELEDLTLKYRFPEEYRQIEQKIHETEPDRVRFIEKFNAPLIEVLKANRIDFEISGRVKSVYSIWSKMQRKQIPFEEVYDLFAIRIVFKPSPLIPEKSQCWHIYSLVTDIYKPKPDRLRDWVNIPKANGYEALHSTVMGPDGVWVEVQIRSQRMEEIAERGFAAHWKYKLGLTKSDSFEQRLMWVRQMLENQQDTDAEEYVRTLKVDMFADEVFVFTPRGDVVNLPAGATPIDFAYSIHSAVGNAMTGAKVNGRIVTFDYQLQSGDIVEVITSKSAHGPSRDWMKICKSNEARNKIKQWFKKERREENIVTGRSMFESELKRTGISLAAITSEEVLPHLLKKVGSGSLDDLYAAIGYGGISSLKVIGRIREDIQRILHQHQVERQAEVPVEGHPEVTRPAVPKRTHSEKGIIVEGLSNCLVKFSRCCTPVPGDDIIGFITRNQGVSVHRTDCQNMIDLKNKQPERVVEVEWTSTKGLFMVKIQVEALDRRNLLSDVTRVLSDHGVNIISGTIATGSDRVATSQFSFEMADPQHLNTLLAAVRKIEGVFDVYRITGAKDSAEPRLRKM